jgi:hypothetical protein
LIEHEPFRGSRSSRLHDNHHDFVIVQSHHFPLWLSSQVKSCLSTMCNNLKSIKKFCSFKFLNQRDAAISLGPHQRVPQKSRHRFCVGHTRFLRQHPIRCGQVTDTRATACARCGQVQIDVWIDGDCGARRRLACPLQGTGAQGDAPGTRRCHNVGRLRLCFRVSEGNVSLNK